MSTAIAKNFQVGSDSTATNNFTIRQPATPDGTVRIANGNSGTTTDLVTVTSAGNVGVGTTSPAYAIHAAGNVNGNVTVASNNTSSGTSAFSRFLALADAGNAQFGMTSSAYTDITGATDALLLNANNASGGMAFALDGVLRMKLDSSGNLGLGVTPSAWDSTWRALESLSGALGSNSGAVAITQNAIPTVGGWQYKTSSFAHLYYQRNGQHQWYQAPSGTAGTGIAWTQAMTLDTSGNFQIGTTTSGGAYATFGNSSAAGANRWAAVFGTNSDSAGNPSSFGLTVGWNYSSGGGENNIIYGTSAGSTPGLAFSSYNGTTITERARITSGGDLLVGTTNSSEAAANGFIVNGAIKGYVAASLAASTNTSYTYHVYSTGAGAYRFYVGLGGTVYATSTTISAISDQRLKENIQDIDVGLDKIMALKPRKFDWKAGKGKDIKGDRGWIAQEFEQVFPDMIDEWRDPAPEGEEPYKSVRADLIPVLVAAIQELKAELDSVKTELALLKGTA